MGSKYAKAEIFDLIGDLVSPYVGDAVGRSVGAAFTKKLGLNDVDVLSGEDVDRVLKQLNLALNVFLGGARADEVHAEVKRAIENRSGS